MNAMYFLATANGTSKKTGRPWWGISVLHFNASFGKWIAKLLLTSEDYFNEVENMVEKKILLPGDAVNLNLSLDGGCSFIERNKTFKPLNFSEKS